MTAATKALKFLRRLEVPEGPLSGRKVKIAPFQADFVRGALAPGVSVACLSIARGNAKSALSAGLALGALLGEWDRQPRREIPLVARTKDQARIAWNYVAAFARTLPDEVQAQLEFRRQPRYEIQFNDDNGPHVIRALAADGKSALGLSPAPLALLDERAAWPADQGAELEHAILTALGKRGGRALILSTSAPDDANAFSRWLDEEQEGVYRQEHRPAPGLPADDVDSLLIANPGAPFGIGASTEWLVASARRAIAKGGSTLSAFRNLNRNERVSAENRDVLLTVDEWLACETADPPPREGQCIIGCDLGGSASMSAAVYYWPSSGRLEARGWFPSKPGLLDRGQRDGVGSRYVEMKDRGELDTLGEQTVPVAAWLVEVMRHVEDQNVAAIVADRYKQSEVGEALAKAGIRAPIVWRGMGYRDGNEDIQRTRRACYDGKVKSPVSLLMRSALADTVCLKDPAANLKLARSRSNGRIDPASAMTLAVAEGARIQARGEKRPARWAWT